MGSFELPKRWYDTVWLETRHTLIAETSAKDRELLISLGQCEWIDIQPLSDLLLQVCLALLDGVNVSLNLGRTDSVYGVRRSIRFLRDTGFIDCLREFSSERGTFRLVLNGQEFSLGTGDSQPTLSLPPKALDYEPLIPCTVIDVRALGSRPEIAKKCRELRALALSRTATALRVPASLLDHGALFFDSVLPELIDNVLIHKKETDPSLCALFVRIRRRQEETEKASRLIESETDLTELNRRTAHLWQYDVIEAVFADGGATIQESWLQRWNATSRRKTESPVLPSGTSVQGPNGDAIILQGVLDENATSLSRKERKAHQLPTKLTGLHSIRQSIESLDWHFSVRSGRNYVVASLGGKNPSRHFKPVKPMGRYHPTPGVNYLFRFASESGRKLVDWHNPAKVVHPPKWWISEYPERFRRAHVIEEFKVPPCEAGDVLLCRVMSSGTKQSLLAFMQAVTQAKLNLIFCDLAEPVALRLSLLVRDFMKYDRLKIRVPIITNSLFVRVPDPDENESIGRDFAGIGPSTDKLWWRLRSAPIQDVTEVFARLRQVDSREFWRRIENDDAAFLKERVQWNDNTMLVGGYLGFAQALRHEWVRKMFRRRLAASAHAAGASDVSPATSVVRRLVTETRLHGGLEYESDSRVAVVGSVEVTDGASTPLSTAPGPLKSVRLPTFVYPSPLILTTSATATARNADVIRAMDWSPPSLPDIVSKNIQDSAPAELHQLGRTGRVRRRAAGLLKFDEDVVLESPTDAYGVWQRQDLLRLGHYSYNRHHFLIWVDLLAFVTSRNSHANDLISTIAKEVHAIRPYAVFFEPNEVTEVLLERIRELANREKLDGVPIDRMWPSSVIVDYSHLPTGSINASDPNIAAAPAASKAVFIDDICVTGRTAGNVVRHLRALGYGDITSFFVLDLSDGQNSETVVTDLKKKSWWSWAIPRVGTDSSCRICRGRHALRLLAGRTSITGVAAALNERVAWAARSDVIGRFHARVQDRAIEPVPHRLGTKAKEITLRSTIALAAWAVDMASRLNNSAYITRTESNLCDQVEVVIATVSLLWRDLNPSQQHVLLRNVATLAWSETRADSATALLVVVAGLETEDLVHLSHVVESRLIHSGLPTFRVAVFAYSVLALAESDAEVFRSRLRSIVKRVPDSAEDQYARARATLSLFADESENSLGYESAISIAGLPGRGLSHYHIYSLLKNIPETHKSKLLLGLLELAVFLEPIRRVFRNRADVVPSKEARARVTEVLDDLEKVTAALRHRSLADMERIRQVCDAIHQILCIGIHNDRSVRDYLSRQFIHYLPYVVRTEVNALVLGSKLAWDDFEISPTITLAEQQLLSGGINDDEHWRCLEQLQQLDVVYADRVELHQVVRDLLADVKHAVRKRPKGPIMTVECSVRTLKSRRYYSVRFSNYTTQELADAAEQGRSWSLARSVLEKVGGTLSHSYTDGRLKRTVMIPIYAAPKESENGND